MKKLFFPLFLLIFCSFFGAEASKKSEESKPDRSWMKPAMIALGLGAWGLKKHYLDRSPSFGNLFFTGALFATSATFFLLPRNNRIGEFLSSSLGLASPILLGVYLLKNKVSSKEIGIAIENLGKAMQEDD